MIRQFLQSLLGEPGAASGQQQIGVLLKLALVALLAAAAWLWLRRGGAESGFQVREADRKKQGKDGAPGRGAAEGLADARMKPRAGGKPLALPGVRIEGEPHEILGIPEDATRDRIQAAWRDLMKRYHPDKVGPSTSSQWKDAQKIAEAINRAKEEMLKRARR